ncbi:MAG: MFS transporter [Blastocatellia bacterium]|nr:MFS transporter [Blastocatellia bacterium]
MTSPQKHNTRGNLLQDSNFRWLLGGGLVSMLGDQFTLIALPWLVLTLSNDTFILGSVIAVLSIPRAVFILVGGAFVDRYSPKTVLLLTKYINTALLGALAALVLTGTLNLGLLYVLALGIGLASAFSFPSGTAITPLVAGPANLQAANSIMMSLRQLTLLGGPLLAGLLIALSGTKTNGAASPRGIGLAFAFDSFSFLFSAWTLMKVQLHPTATVAKEKQSSAVFQSIIEGLRFFWNDRSLRALCLFNAAIALFIGGPIQVAMPVLANTRLGQNAAAFGALMAAHGAGTLLGMVVSGMKREGQFKSLGWSILVCNGISGLFFIPLGLINATWEGMALLGGIGLLGGFIQIATFTWMQQRIPTSMMGRAMSLFMFIFMGLAPLSAAITGWVMRSLTVSQLFGGTGVLLLVIVLVSLTSAEIRSITPMKLAEEKEFV